MPHQANGVSILNQRIFTGDLLIDRDQDLLLPQQLKHVAKLDPLPLDELPNRLRGRNFTSEVSLSVSSLQLSCQYNGDHVRIPHDLVGQFRVGSVIDSARTSADNDVPMQSLDVHNPGMPDLQFVLFVSALCTSNLNSINIPEDLRRTIFDRCWALIHTEAPPTNPKDRVLDLRGGTELTLEACVAMIRSLLTEAGIVRLMWDHPVSDPTHDSTPAAKPLIDRLGQLYPDDPDIVDPRHGPPPGSA